MGAQLVLLWGMSSVLFVSLSIYMNVRIQRFMAEDCALATWPMLFILTVNGLNGGGQLTSTALTDLKLEGNL